MEVIDDKSRGLSHINSIEHDIRTEAQKQDDKRIKAGLVAILTKNKDHLEERVQELTLARDAIKNSRKGTKRTKFIR